MSPLTESTRLTLAKTPGTGLDADAAAYIAAVEAADGQALEAGVRWNIDQFVRGCKADGIWTAIKASCILSGARTLSGALVPLVGTAPTNFNFVSGDYDRKTGLVGDGSTKYLDSNRATNADPQNSFHLCVYASTLQTVPGVFAGAEGASRNTMYGNYGTTTNFALRQSTVNVVSTPALIPGTFAASRSSSTLITWIAGNYNGSVTAGSTLTPTGSMFIFARNSGTKNHTDARLSFFSMGEALDLALLDSRISTLITSNALVIP